VVGSGSDGHALQPAQCLQERLTALAPDRRLPVGVIGIEGGLERGSRIGGALGVGAAPPGPMFGTQCLLYPLARPGAELEADVGVLGLRALVELSELRTKLLEARCLASIC